MSDLGTFDITVIGGGVIGCAVARRMTLDGAKVLLVEKSSDILTGASKANSAILHTGFDAPENSVELECIRAGYAEYLSIHQSMNLPLLKTSALVTAWTEEEEDKFANIMKRAENNGINNLQLLTAKAARKQEPYLANNILSAIKIPGEYVIDPWSAPLAYLQQAIDNGCQTQFNTEVRGGEFDGEYWDLQTNNGNIKTKFAINSAGLYGDILDQNVLGAAEFTIKPRKGEFVVFNKTASKLLTSIILPVPTESSKGVVVFPTIFGNVAVGPTADEQQDRADTSVNKTRLKSLYAHAIARIPALKNTPVTAVYAGIRPATEKKYYRLKNVAEKNWLTLCGIRSTGLTAALGIAQQVQKILQKDLKLFTKIAAPVTNPVPNIAEHLPRDWQVPGNDEIICHCELVTKREILQAMLGVIPAGNLSGLKRRTRVTMGSCQGFYCTARLSELTKNKFRESIAVAKIR